ncbi:MAG: Ig-like domain-containing protein [Pirellulales bacterium]
MGRHRSRAWGRTETSGKSRGRIARVLPTRHLRLEALEARLLLSLAGFPPLGGLEWIAAATDEPAEAGTRTEIAFSGEAGILTAAPAAPDLLDVSDTGVSNTDNLTNLDNSSPEKVLRFSVGNTIPGAAVVLYADGKPIGSAVAEGTTTTVTTNGSLDLTDGLHAVTARQTMPGESESTNSAALVVTIDTVAPVYLNPVRLGGYDTSGAARSVTVVGTLAYVADNTAGLQIIDVSNPTAPVRLGGYDTSGNACGVAVSGTRAYVADGAGLEVIDVTNPRVPVRLGGYQTSGDTWDVAVSGTLAYVADGNAGLQIIDVSNPLRGRYDSSGTVYGVAVSGTLAYVADGTAGLQIIDVTNPRSPVRLGGYATSGIACAVAVSGTLAYVADGSAGLQIIDVSNPAAPVLWGRYNTSGSAFGVAVSGALAYVADNDAGLQIIDVSNPAAPVRLGGYDTSGYADTVAVSGTLAYVADYSAGLQIIDVRAAASPSSPDLQPASDTGISSTDNITGDNTPTFDLTVPAGAYFRFYRNGVQISGDYEAGASNTTAVQADGTYRYQVATVDAAGNASVLSPAVMVTVDISIPLAPDLLAASDAGISSTDDLTNLDNSQPGKALAFTVGNTLAGATVTIFADGTAIGNAVAEGATTTVTTSGGFDLADGPHSITARQTPLGKAESPESAALSVTIDTVSPLVTPTLLGRYDAAGSKDGVVIVGTVAYVADGWAGLTTIDFANPSAPVPLGRYDTSGYAHGVAVSGTMAYMADGDAGLQIIDVTDPADPVLVGCYKTGGYAHGVAVSGSLVYLADDDAGLRIIDVTNPAAPMLMGTFDTSGSACAVAVSGTLAYVADYEAGLQIIDVANAGLPVRLGGYDTAGSARAVAVSGSLAYVADVAAGLQIIDVRNPARPVRLGGYDTSGDACGIAVVGKLAYVADAREGLQVLDVSIPSSPAFLGALDTSGVAYGVAVSGTLACVADRDSGLVVIDVSNAANPVRLGGYEPNQFTRGVAVVGTRAYFANDVAGILIIDVSAPDHPRWLGGYDTSGEAHDVAVVGTLAYVADFSAGLQIIDVTNPAAPVRLGGCDTSGMARGVAVSGTTAYVADDKAGLMIIDLSNPVAPVRLGEFDTERAYDVEVVGSTAYVADSEGGLQIIDISSPAAPVRVGGYGSGGNVSDVVVSGTLAYVANGSTGLQIIDVRNPAAPALVGRYDTLGDAWDVAVSGTLAYVADSYAGLQIIDVTNPAAPVRLGGYDTDGLAFGVAASGTLAYLSCDGLHIVDVGVPASPPPPDLQPNSDTGISNTDNLTGDNTPTFNIPVLAGPYFRVYRDGLQISGDCEAGTSYTAPTQPDGTYGYSLAAVDAAGNSSALSAALSVTIDSSMPLAPDLLAISDTGVSSTDNVTTLDNSQPGKSLQFTVGNTVAGAIVTLYADGSAIGSTIAGGATTTVTTSGSLDLADGTHAITARQTVPGRPESPASAVLELVIDTVAPVFLEPMHVGGYNTSGLAWGVAVSGTLAYVADYLAGLQIIDVSNPALPVRLGGYDTSGSAYAVAVSGMLAYVADYSAGLQIIDVTNPAAPVRLGGYDTSGLAYGVAVSGTLAYVVDYGGGLVVLDVSDPAAPIRLGGLDTPGFARDVVVSGTLAYVADQGGGLQIIDVTNPAAPVQLGKYVTRGFAYGVAISGTLAYVASSDAGLEILDVTNPAAPIRLGGYDTSGSAYGVAVLGTRAYVADYAAGLVILDVTNPAAPLWLGRYDTSGCARSVAAFGALAYVADENSGLQIIDGGLPGPPRAPDLQPASDTGVSNTDNITFDTTATFDVAVPAGFSARVYRDGIQISGDYVTGTAYTTDVQPGGTYGYTVAAVDAAGNVSLQSPPLAVTIDTQVPTVTNVLVGGSGWTGEFLADLSAANGQNVGGYSIPVGTGAQLSPLAWGNIDQIKIVFSEGIMVDVDDLVLCGVNTPSYDLAGATFSYDPASFTATWKLASPLAADKLEIRLNADAAGFVQDPIARRLDGEWANPTSPTDTGTDTYPSGNGTAGGDFVFRFRALPCDANQDGAVDIFDVAKLQVNYGQTGGMSPAEGDLDGNGTVDIFDVALLQVQYGRTLDPPAEAPAGAPGAADGERLLPPVAAQPGHSPGESSKIAEAFGGRVSGPPAAALGAEGAPVAAVADGSGLNDRAVNTPEHLTRSARSTGDRQGWTSHPWHTRRADLARSARSTERSSPRLAQTLAVHHAAESASWESAVDQLLDSDEFELASCVDTLR